MLGPLRRIHPLIERDGFSEGLGLAGGSWHCASQHEDAVIQWLGTQQKVVDVEEEE